MNMNNGGGENSREHQEFGSKRKFGGNYFDRAIAKAAFAQLCESVGFQGFQQFALETLSDITLRFIHNMGKTAHSYASLSGRTQCNVFDIVHGLEDLRFGLGYAGASDVDHCLGSSGIVRDIANYIDGAEVVPFAYPIHGFPIFKERKSTPSFWQIGEEPPDEHIPAWLPAFLEPRAYAQLKEVVGKANGILRDSNDSNGLKGEDKVSLPNLQQHSVGGRLEGLSSADRHEVADAMQATECNPFLMEPLRFGEREVSTIANFSKIPIEAEKNNFDLQKDPFNNHFLVNETFGPGVEVVRSRLCDFEKRKTKELLIQRPPIKFKLEITRKSLGLALGSSLKNQNIQKTAPCFAEHYVKEEMKKKARKILKESVEQYNGTM